MCKTKAFCLAQAHPIDDGRMVEGIADDGIVFIQQGFKQAGIGIKTRAIQNGILGTEKFGNRSLQLLMQVLRAADKANRCHAEAVIPQGLYSGINNVFVIGQAQIVVGAEVKYLSLIHISEPTRLC